MSLKQLAANRRNAQKSTGPRTPNGRAVSKMNALKHGIRAAHVVVRGRCIKESSQEFTALRQRFWEDWKPVGATEEMLVDKIVTTHWRLNRVLKAESGEIALSVDDGYRHRRRTGFFSTSAQWAIQGDPYFEMIESAFGCGFLQSELSKVRKSVEKEGELTETAIQSVIFRGKPYFLTNELARLRFLWKQNPNGQAEPAMRTEQKRMALSYIDRELEMLDRRRDFCAKQEETEEKARQAVAVLPSIEVLDKIMRYGTMLQRDLSRDVILLERLQRRRLGEEVPPPTVALLVRL